MEEATGLQSIQLPLIVLLFPWLFVNILMWLPLLLLLSSRLL